MCLWQCYFQKTLFKSGNIQFDIWMLEVQSWQERVNEGRVGVGAGGEGEDSEAEEGEEEEERQSAEGAESHTDAGYRAW